MQCDASSASSAVTKERKERNDAAAAVASTIIGASCLDTESRRGRERERKLREIDQPAFGFPHASSSDVLSHASWWVFMAEDIMTFPFVGNIEVMQNWIVDVRTITFSNLWWQASKI